MKTLSSSSHESTHAGGTHASELPTEITSEKDNFHLPDEFWDAIYEFLQDKYGRDAKMYPSSYGVEVKVSNITWDEM